MARETVVKITCDRCKKSFEQPPASADDDRREPPNPAQRAVLIDAKALGLGEIVFEDLDDRCRRRVTDLVSQLAMNNGSEDAEGTPPGPTEVAGAAGSTTKAKTPKKGGRTMKNDAQHNAPEDQAPEDEEDRDEKEEDEDED